MYDNSNMIGEFFAPYKVNHLQKELAKQKDYYESLLRQYKLMLEHAKMQIKSMEYLEGRETARLRKENIKLRSSLRKLYNKYIKPTQKKPVTNYASYSYTDGTVVDIARNPFYENLKSVFDGK